MFEKLKIYYEILIIVIIYSGENTIPCSQCDQTFFTASNLEYHMRCHTGICSYSKAAKIP